MTKAEFQRTFKASSEAWKKALHHAKLKEHGYVSRCSHYLKVNKQVVEKAKLEIHNTPALEVVHIRDNKTGENKVLLQRQKHTIDERREIDLNMHFDELDETKINEMTGARKAVSRSLSPSRMSLDT